MALPTALYEIAFATAPNDPSPTWVDVTQYVRARSGYTITRGRQDEFGEVQPSKCVLWFENSDGRFTAGNTSSPYYPNVKKGRRLRVTETWNAVTYRRFTGYVDEWPVTWTDASAVQALAQISASSRLARLGRGVELRSIVEEEYLKDSPIAYYTFSEPEGATVAGNSSATTQQPLAAAGSGAVPTFGTATGPGTDDLTAASFTGGKYLEVNTASPLLTSAHTTVLVECFFSTTSSDISLVRLSTGAATGDTTEVILLKLDGSGFLEGISASFGTTTGTTISAGAVNNGATHHAAIRQTISGGTLTTTLYLDGAVADTDTFSFAAFSTYSWLSVGGKSFGTINGTMAHVAVTVGTTEVSTTRVDAHSDSGLNGFSGERSDQRISRLAGYAGVPSAEVSLETGLSTSVVNQITNGKTPIALMQEIVATESGLLFDARDGTLTFHARSHRYTATSALTLSGGGAELQPNLEPKLDDQGLVNDITTSRDGGVTARAVDLASITDYGLYRDTIVLLTTSDNEVQDAANWKIGVGATPQVRVPTAEADVEKATSAQKALILAREIGDRITLASLPSQAPATSMDFFIEGYTEHRTAEAYRISWNLSPATASGVWQLDSSTYSVLGTSTRLGY